MDHKNHYGNERSNDSENKEYNETLNKCECFFKFTFHVILHVMIVIKEYWNVDFEAEMSYVSLL